MGQVLHEWKPIPPDMHKSSQRLMLFARPMAVRQSALFNKGFVTHAPPDMLKAGSRWCRFAIGTLNQGFAIPHYSLLLPFGKLNILHHPTLPLRLSDSGTAGSDELSGRGCWFCVCGAICLNSRRAGTSYDFYLPATGGGLS